MSLLFVILGSFFFQEKYNKRSTIGNLWTMLSNYHLETMSLANRINIVIQPISFTNNKYWLHIVINLTLGINIITLIFKPNFARVDYNHRKKV